MSSKKQALYTTAQETMRNGKFSDNIKLMPKMLKAVFLEGWGKQYHAKSRILLSSLAILYIISPIDIIPELFLTIPGLVDDAAVSLFAITNLLNLSEQWAQEKIGVYQTADTINGETCPPRP